MPDDVGQVLDLQRAGTYGHSAGGTTAAEVMVEDRCIGAAINMGGFPDCPTEEPGGDGAPDT